MSSGWNMLFDPKKPGWIPPEERTADMQRSHERFLDDTPHVSEVFHGGYNEDRPRIWQLVKQAHEKGLVPDEYMRNGTLKNLNQLTGSCFPAGTLVRMADGSERPIDEIQVGDRVISHTGQPRRVLRTFCRKYTGELVTIRVASHPFPLTATSDHRIATVPFRGKKFSLRSADMNRFVWTEAENLTTDSRVLIGRMNDFYGDSMAPLTSPGSAVKAVKSVKRHRFGIARRVLSTHRQHVTDTNVYCLEVEEDHSFLANGLCVSNCVGFGAGNALLWASVVDAIHRRQQERIVVPFVLYHYGRGRLHSGIRGRGEGSTGSGQAKALQQDGYLAFDSPNCPSPQFADVVKWSSGLEMEWSDGARIGEQYLTEGRQHLAPNVVRVTSLDEAQMLLDSYYVFTIASSWGGMMRCPVQDGVLLNRRTGTWMHQMFVLDYITHPRLGRLWWVGNNWGYVHGKDPGGEWDGNTGAPEGGFYISDSDMSYIIRQNETFAFSDPQGFVDRSRLSWRMF